MGSPLEAIAFLGRSDNRVQVLQSLADENRTREDLRAELPISRTTLARILNEFEERGWIARNGQHYTTTRAADAILAKFDPLLETVEGIENLGEAIDWLPPPAYSVELRHFRDADITTSTGDNPAKPYDRGIELIRAADRYRGLTSTAIPRYVKVLGDRLAQGQLDFGGVIAAEFIETLHDDPDRAAPWYDFAAAGRTWIYDDRVPINMHIVDDTVLVWLGERREGSLEIHGLLESENAAVLSWAESLYEEYRSEAARLDTSMLP